MYAMWHVSHHPPFLEVFERGCQAGAGGAGGPGGREVPMVHEVKQVRAVLQVH